MQSAIELQGLKKSFRLVHGQAGSIKALLLSFKRRKPEELMALKGVDLSIAKGETLAVIGRNGSGKSTMLGIVGRIYKPTSGKVIVHGRVSALLELGAGFHPELTGIENIYLNGAILGIKTRDMKSKVDEIVRFAELEKFIDTPIKGYSKGMVMRLGFAIAVQVDPDILLVDEVLAVGDEAFQAKCYEKISEFQRLGKTIVFVSHDLPAVRRVASRVVWLDKGVIRMDGPTGQVVDAYMAGVAADEQH
ncbi:MAG TPA: ABC transporter ATP-binding protein [Armatimonadota bacterium]|mgnify:CR=1 FL=1|nr:ABC transporter ATP-binding protein [Armatimonadota bacterium]HOP80051.1 ABC transporter ATP-binding protein [Armatimonadota bacterium]HPP74270.1 ABC transporter ATP-binding protein [Armatimonadota bacterium]